MIDFMVLAAPRSGTCWAANWLTGDTALCLHDPLWTMHYEQLDEMLKTTGDIGIACTGSALFPDWVLPHPARKVILHRDVREIDLSLVALGMPRLQREYQAALQSIPGMHVHWLNLFNPTTARNIWTYLLPQVPFNAARHRELCGYNVQRQLSAIKVNRDASARLLAELSKSL